MKISLLSSEKEMSIEIKGKIEKDRLAEFSEYLDHATLKKSDVNYNKAEGYLILKVERNDYEKKKKTFLWFNIWVSGKYPTKHCILKVNDVESCDIRDEDIINKEDTILIGGVHVSDDEIYIGSFCEHENAYGITLKVKRINISLEDQNTV
jgi:hypothetical protein